MVTKIRSLRSSAIITLLMASAASAQPCNENFTSSGNLLTGKTYQTWGIAQGVRRSEAFPRVYAFTAANGFTILSADREAGVVSASQSVAYGNGKTVPLTVTLQDEVEGTRIGLAYATSGGLHSPEASIRRHFCQTIAAAASLASPTSEATVQSTGSKRSHVRQLPRGYAQPTAEQRQTVQREIQRGMQSERLHPLLEDAAPVIAEFVERLACLADLAGASALNEFSTSGNDLGGLYMAMGPMRSAPYHSKSSCMSVARIHGWLAPANNALRFEVLYKADDSGETAKLVHEAIRQSDGVWLFSR